MLPKNRFIAALLTLLLGACCLVANGKPEKFSYKMSGKPKIEKVRLLKKKPRLLQKVEQRLRLCTYNTQDFRDGLFDGDHHGPEIAKRQANGVASILFEIDPDIVIFQEMENIRALQLLNKTLKHPYASGAITSFDKQRRGARLNIGVLSRVPLENLRELDFSRLLGRGAPPRGVLSFQVDLGNKHRLLVYGLHLKSNWGTKQQNRTCRLNAMKLIRDDVEKVMAATPHYKWEVMLAGDMNTDPDNNSFKSDPSLKPFSDWVDLWRGKNIDLRATMPTRFGVPSKEFPPAAFDRFIVSRSLQNHPWLTDEPMVLRRGVHTERNVRPGYEGHISDHWPAYVDIWRTLTPKGK